MAVMSALWFSVLLLQHVGFHLSAGAENVSCPVLAGVPGSPGHNGLPGQDGRDGQPGPKGDKGEIGLSMQGPPGKAGPAGLTGPKGSKGEPGDPLSGSLKHEVEKLKEQLTVMLKEINTKVAFTASLSPGKSDFRNIGPFPENRILVYETAVTNIGNAYNTSTGVFTAPVRGVYYFIFILFNPNTHASGLSLMKNGEQVVFTTDNTPGADTEDTACNSVSLVLEKGDLIHLELLHNRKVYTDNAKRNTFSGHLLFTM